MQEVFQGMPATLKALGRAYATVYMVAKHQRRARLELNSLDVMPSGVRDTCDAAEQATREELARLTLAMDAQPAGTALRERIVRHLSNYNEKENEAIRIVIDIHGDTLCEALKELG